jgi:hypothetical protein
MTVIEMISLLSIFSIYIASQQLLNWWGRVELKAPPYTSL